MKLFLILTLLLIPSLAWGGVDFDAVDDAISLLSPASLDDLGSQTISAWVYSEGPGENNLGYIYSKIASGGSGPRFIRDDSTRTDGLVFGAHSSGTATRPVRVANASSLADNVWAHVLATWDGGLVAANIHIYVNGTEVSYAFTLNGSTAIVSDASNNAFIGNTVDNDRTFNGIITEVAIWDIELSTAQRTQLASSRLKGIPLQVAPGNLVSYWPLDEHPIQTNIDGLVFKDLASSNNGTASDVDGNGQVVGEVILSYPAGIIQGQ